MADDETANELSDFGKTLATMTQEQLSAVATIVQTETVRRDDPMKRLGAMSDYELQRFKDQVGI